MTDTPDLTPDAVTHSAATCLLLDENSICEVDCRSLSAALATERARVALLEAALLATTQREAATIARYDARLAKADAYAEAAEAKLAEYKMVASAIDNQWAQEVEAVRALTAERDALAEKLAEVVGLAEEVTSALAQQIGQRRHKSWALIRRATATLADIRAMKGGT